MGKMKGAKGRQLFKSPECHFIQKERGLQQKLPASVCLCDQKLQSPVRTQILDVWRTGQFFAHPGSCRLYASCYRNIVTTRTGECVATTMLRAGIDLTAVYCLVLPWKLQVFNTLQRSKVVISDGFCQCRWGSQVAGASYSAVFPESYSMTSLLKPYARFYLFLFIPVP